MKITVVAVGKLKERFWADACAEYVKRLGAYVTVKMVEVADRDPAKSGGEEAGRELEGKGILAAIPERSHDIFTSMRPTFRFFGGLVHSFDSFLEQFFIFRLIQ